MLYIVATPIGNLEDMSLRAIRILKEADVIVAEDTRHVVPLLKHFEIPHKPLVSLYEENESNRMNEILSLLNSDQKVAMVSDAGTPLISDPGYKLTREAVKMGVKVEAIPGPTALITALVSSGLPPDKFLFLGFLLEKETHRKDLLEKTKEGLEKISATVILYVSPYKLSRDLKTIEEVFGDIEVVLGRELTKLYEQVWRGKISEAKKEFVHPKGEFVLLFHL